MNLVYIDQPLQKQWQSLVKNAPYSGFMQSFFWADFKAKTGWQTYKIGISENNKLIGGAIVYKFQFSKNKNFLYIPQGPILPYDQEKYFHTLISEIDKVADLKGENLTTHLRIEPRLNTVPEFFNKFTKAPYNMEPRNTLMIDLHKSEQEILSQMKPKGRYNIKIAQKNNIEITQRSDQKAIEDFLYLYHQTVKRDKFEAKNDQYFQVLIPHLFQTQTGALFFAEYKNEPLATALIIFHGAKVTYFFGASGSEHREKMAPYLLHFKIIREAKKHDYKWYDFLGIAPKNDPEHGWKGLSAFKQKFGGEIFDFIGAYDFVYNQKLYAQFLKESGELK